MPDWPRIETSRLFCRPLVRGDVDRLHQIFTNPSVRKYLWDDEVIPRERTAWLLDASRGMFAEQGLGLWGVRLRQGGAMIGFGGYWHFFDPPELQLLFGFLPDHWGQGMATELSRALIRFGFEERGFERVRASADAPNKASLRVMEKSGMTFDKRVWIQGRETVFYEVARQAFTRDPSHYAIIRPEAMRPEA